ncbi:hypothetical protein NQ314_000539 [Rhamnusium bicolor]|uniref:Uncharacterized protein n=1 Tax=Rhamnusium bicolor TaxID=1586634 RepID=A0AAV8ZXY8_9CUCU|nr:hypothetical protein NQ314_000539 [Rhamnusium bicolor]
MEAIREGTYVGNDYNYGKNINSTDDEAPVNEPDLMKRHRADVEFHSPLHMNNTKNYTIHERVDTSEITDPKMMKKLLESLQMKSKTFKKGTVISKEPNTHAHRNSTIAKDETENFKIEPPKAQSTSAEILNDILNKLKTMGVKGSTILAKVNEEFNQKKHNDAEPVIDTKGRHYSKPVVNYDENIDKARRRKRDLILSTAEEMIRDDEENDKGIEEGFTPDGIANHRGIFNETTLNDMSNSEFWSSFSSSEEALLNCAGLILNLPLTPHHKCQEHLSEDDVKESYRDNTITYK